MSGDSFLSMALMLGRQPSVGVQLPYHGTHTQQITTCQATGSAAWSSYPADSHVSGDRFCSMELIPSRQSHARTQLAEHCPLTHEITTVGEQLPQLEASSRQITTCGGGQFSRHGAYSRQITTHIDRGQLLWHGAYSRQITTHIDRQLPQISADIHMSGKSFLGMELIPSR
jgi:hypothetical protein